MTDKNQLPENPEDVTSEDISAMLTVPEVLPCEFDKTIEFWLSRLEFWGKLKIVHVDTKNKKFLTNKKVDITREQVVEKMANAEEIKRFGKWSFKKLSLKSVEIYRNYYDENDKLYRESICIDIDLKPSIKRAMQGKL